MNLYSVTYHFEFWSGTIFDITVLAKNKFQAERLAKEKASRKYHDFMVMNGIPDIDIRSVKLICEKVPMELLEGSV